MWESSKLNDSALASVSMGYQVGVTPLQMAAAASVIANGGTLLRAARGARRRQGRRAHDRAAEGGAAGHPARDRGDADRHHGGGGDRRHREGRRGWSSYDVAGKTGTADKLVNGRYSPSQQNVSFVGFVPSRNPVLTVIVMVDSPRVGGDTGGAIAAPIFKRIADASLRHLGVTPTINPAPPVMVARQAAAHRSRRSSSPAVVALPAASTGTGLPDLSGLSAREALRELARLGLTARLQGAGVVVHQDPPAGTPLEPGGSCTLVLNRRPGVPPRRGSARPEPLETRAVETAVILGDVVDALRDLTVHAPPAGVARNAPIAAIAYDSRRVVPGSVFVALKGLKADGGAFVEQAIVARREGDRVGIGAARHDRRALAHRSRRAAGAGAAGRSFLRSSEPAHAGHRRHRHQRQDHHGLPAAVDPRCRRPARRHAGHRRLPHRRRGSRSLTHHARSPGRAAALERDDRAGLALGGHGSVVARAVVEARRRHALRRRRLHQPDARSPRLPRRHGGLLRREAAPVRDAAGGRARRDQHGRPARGVARRDLRTGRSPTRSTPRPMSRPDRSR